MKSFKSLFLGQKSYEVIKTESQSFPMKDMEPPSADSIINNPGRNYGTFESSTTASLFSKKNVEPLNIITLARIERLVDKNIYYVNDKNTISVQLHRSFKHSIKFYDGNATLTAKHHSVSILSGKYIPGALYIVHDPSQKLSNMGIEGYAYKFVSDKKNICLVDVLLPRARQISASLSTGCSKIASYALIKEITEKHEFVVDFNRTVTIQWDDINIVNGQVLSGSYNPEDLYVPLSQEKSAIGGTSGVTARFVTTQDLGLTVKRCYTMHEAKAIIEHVEEKIWDDETLDDEFTASIPYSNSTY